MWGQFGMDLLKSVSVAAISALIAFFLTKRYLSKIILANNFKNIGVGSFITEKPKKKELKKLFSEYKEICIMFVSGKGFFKEHFDIIKEAAENGTEFKLLIAKPKTLFLHNIEELEVQSGIREEGSHISDEIVRVTKQFVNIENGKQILKNISIRYFCDEYRSPIIICRNHKNGDAYRTDCFLYVTLTPYLSSKSAILRLYMDKKTENGGNLNLVEMAETHFDAVWKKSEPLNINDYTSDC